MAEKTRGEDRRDWLTDLVLRGVIRSVLALPYETRVPVMGRLVAHVIGPLAGYRRRALRNLAFIHPEMGAAERGRIARAVLDNFGRTMIENYSGADFVTRMAATEPEGPGWEAFRAAKAEGRPVLLMTGHFGNYESVRACLNARGYTVGALYKPMANSYFNSHYVRSLEQVGEPMFTRDRAGTKGFLRHLKSGGSLVMLFDLFVHKAPALSFLGQPALTTTSPAEMALRHDALMIPFFGIRDPDGIGFRMRMETPIAPTTPEEMMQALNDRLEAQVRAHPEQWFWLHRRWRGKGAPR